MGIFVDGKQRPDLAFEIQERSRNKAARTLWFNVLFQRSQDDGPYRGALLLRALAESFVQRFGNIDRGSNSHCLIMS